MTNKMENVNYTDYWDTDKALDNYLKKFSTKIDHLRHLLELEIIKKYSKGKLYDCSIGEGRFIGNLEVDYCGSDYSDKFIN